MQLWEYTLLSLIGVVLCHYFSELYSIKNKIIYFVCYLLFWVILVDSTTTSCLTKSLLTLGCFSSKQPTVISLIPTGIVQRFS